jgi:serine protease Do
MKRRVPHRATGAAVAALLAVTGPGTLCAQGASTEATAQATDPALDRMLKGGDPATPHDLEVLQAHVQSVLRRVGPATVALEGATGVIVKGNLVLTAGHVTRTKGRKMTITLADGRKLEGESLGANLRADTGLIKILTEGDYPCCEMGADHDLERGEWCLMLGHPGGSKPGRQAPARLGRVLRPDQRGFVVTDCTMEAGDSGGPLVDMCGRVIGINSRISADLAENMHVPVRAFTGEWDQLVAGEVIGAPAWRGRVPRLGIGARLDFASGEAVVGPLPADSVAAKAGLREGDVVRKIDGETIADRRDVNRAMIGFQPDQDVNVEVQRGEETLTLQLKISREGR